VFASQPATDAQRNITNVVVALSSVEMVSLQLDQAERMCASQSVTVRELQRNLKSVHARFTSLLSLVRSQAIANLGSKAEAEYYQKVYLGNQRLVEQVRSSTASTPQIGPDRCKAILASYQGQVNGLNELAASIESQPDIGRK
jgi:hypothetical protein